MRRYANEHRSRELYQPRAPATHADATPNIVLHATQALIYELRFGDNNRYAGYTANDIRADYPPREKQHARDLEAAVARLQDDSTKQPRKLQYVHHAAARIACEQEKSIQDLAEYRRVLDLTPDVANMLHLGVLHMLQAEPSNLNLADHVELRSKIVLAGEVILDVYHHEQAYAVLAIGDPGVHYGGGASHGDRGLIERLRRVVHTGKWDGQRPHPTVMFKLLGFMMSDETDTQAVARDARQMLSWLSQGGATEAGADDAEAGSAAGTVAPTSRPRGVAAGQTGVFGLRCTQCGEVVRVQKLARGDRCPQPTHKCCLAGFAGKVGHHAIRYPSLDLCRCPSADVVFCDGESCGVDHIAACVCRSCYRDAPDDIKLAREAAFDDRLVEREAEREAAGAAGASGSGGGGIRGARAEGTCHMCGGAAYEGDAPPASSAAAGGRYYSRPAHRCSKCDLLWHKHDCLGGWRQKAGPAEDTSVCPRCNEICKCRNADGVIACQAYRALMRYRKTKGDKSHKTPAGKDMHGTTAEEKVQPESGNPLQVPTVEMAAEVEAAPDAPMRKGDRDELDLVATAIATSLR